MFFLYTAIILLYDEAIDLISKFNNVLGTKLLLSLALTKPIHALVPPTSLYVYNTGLELLYKTYIFADSSLPKLRAKLLILILFFHL